MAKKTKKVTARKPTAAIKRAAKQPFTGGANASSAVSTSTDASAPTLVRFTLLEDRVSALERRLPQNDRRDRKRRW